MKKIIVLSATILAFQVNAQLKIGNNVKTLNSNANLQVESNSAHQVIITRDSGKLGIGTLTPAAQLDIVGNVKITDGTQGNGKVLVSDANGLASWKNASTIQAASTDSTTASNGLTLSGKDVQLGGTLTKATTINTSASNTIALAGLQSGASTDSILVVNPSTGVIKRLSPSVLGSASEPWYSTATSKGATLNTENIFQMGKVGINTNNPIEQFDVNGNINQRGYTYFRKVTGNTSAYIWTNFNAGGDKINYSFNYQNADGTDSVYNSGYGTNTFSQSNYGFSFNTSNGVNGASPTTNVVTITNVGRVGINTSNPSAKLHVIDTANNTPLKLEGLASGSITTDSVLVATSTGVVKKVSLTSAVDNTVGAISIFPYSAIPSGYLECNGQAISRTSYSDLFAKIGTTYGTGNGSTTFNLPDLRGEFVRGWDNGRGVDAGRTIGSNQTATSIAESIGIWTQTTGNVGSSQVILNADSKSFASGYASFSNQSWSNNWAGTYLNLVRPRNVAMVYAIKVTPSLSLSSGGSSSSTNEPWYSTTTNTGATSNTDNVYQMGNVGVLTSTPQTNLDVAPSSGGAGINVGTVGTANTDQAYITFASKYNRTNVMGSASNLGWQIGTRGNAWATATNKNAFHFSYWDGSAWKENISMLPTGYVGIGVLNPSLKLEVDGAISTKLNAGIGSVRLTPGINTNTGYIEFYESNGSTRAGYIGWANNGNLLYNADNGYKHYFQGAGIYVAGASSYSVSNYVYYGNTVWTTGTHGVRTGVSNPGTNNYSVYATDRLATVEVNVFSDKRIKNILGKSDASEDLQTLMKLSVKDYSMKDFIQYGDKKFKKVIAQEVEEVYPMAISQSTNFIPDVFAPAKVANVDAEMIELKLPKDHNFKVSDTVKMYLAGKETQVKIESISSKQSFKINKQHIKEELYQDVFVYGKLVHDFRTVDYDALSMLNISATQELYKKIEALEKQNEQLQKIQSGFEILKAEIQNLKKDLYKEISLK